MNCSLSIYDDNNGIRIFSIFFYSMLIVVGTFGNIVAVLVIRITKSKGNSRNVFTALAAADTLTLWINPIRYWILHVFNYEIRTYTNGMCKFHTFVSYSSRDIASWILCLLTFERFIAAFDPYESKIIWRGYKKYLTWFIIIVILLAKNCSVIWHLEIISSYTQLCLCDTPDISFRHRFFYFDIIVYSIFPSVLLLIFNLGILRALKKAKVLRLEACQVNQKSHLFKQDSIWRYRSTIEGYKVRKCPNKKMSNLANRLLIPVTIFHLVTSLPLCIFSILEANLEWKNNKDRIFVLSILNTGSLFVMLTSCNNGVNFILYFLSSVTFRRHSKLVLFKWLKCCGIVTSSDRNSNEFFNSTLVYQRSRNITCKHSTNDELETKC